MKYIIVLKVRKLSGQGPSAQSTLVRMPGYLMDIENNAWQLSE